MHRPTVLLLLIFTNAVASEPNCLQIPNVPNARPQNPKAEYERGYTLSFTCDVGYVSGRPIKYVCSAEGWWLAHRHTCQLKPCVLPDDIPNGYYEFLKGEHLVFGTTIKYICNDGYQMVSKEDTRTCFTDGWSNHIPVCEPLSCDAPPLVPGITVEGLSYIDEPIQPDRVLTFSCSPGFSLNGSKILVCGKDGKWNVPFPNCVEAVCELPEPGEKMHFLGAEGRHVSAGQWITVQCVNGGSSKQLQCLSSGQWDSTFPSCRDTCDVVNVPDSVWVSLPNVRQRKRGQTLQFTCKARSHVLHGASVVRCLEDGRWSHPFPSCTGPRSCGSPPSLEHGDYMTTATEFDHNTVVEYHCQSIYTRQGRYKTCNNGEWTGEVTCLKPCTVDQALMAPNNLKFKVDQYNKLYAPHLDHLTFQCADGARHDGAVEMRQQCIDGQMTLPKCVF